MGVLLLTAACGGGGGNKTLRRGFGCSEHAYAGEFGQRDCGGVRPGPGDDREHHHHLAETWLQRLAKRDALAQPKVPGGACAEVSFANPVQDVRWFHVSLDGVEITGTADFAALIHTNGTTGQICDAPAAGFPVGRHTVRIFILDPNNMAAAPMQSVAWSFEVVP